MSKRWSACARAVFFSLLAASTAHAQSILTTAGGGTIDGQLAANIATSAPRGVAFDRAGHVYLSMAGSHQVIRIDSVTGRVRVIAGNGASGFSGDGGLAINATLREPHGLVFDAQDNLFIADLENNRVRRVDATTGIITSFAGGGAPATGIGDGGPATSAFVGRPWGLTISRGGLFITEINYDAHRVRRVDMATGNISTIAGRTDGSPGGFAGDGGPATAAALSDPFAIVADADGNLFVADGGNNRVRRIDTAGIITTYAGGGTLQGTAADGGAATAAALELVLALGFDPNGNLIAGAEPGLRRIDRSTGIISTIDDPGLIWGLGVDTQGFIYYTEATYGHLFKLKPGEEPVIYAGGGDFIGDGRAATAAVLHSPQGLAADAAGNVYIADQYSNRVRRVSASDATITTIAGQVAGAYAPEQEGIDAVDARVGFPRDLAFDAAGNLYIADPLNGRVWRITTDGKIRTFAGGGDPADSVGDNGPATSARIYPVGIAVDQNGNLYIADTDAYEEVPHHRIRRVDAQSGVITTIAGGATPGGTGDGGPASAALLSSPMDVAVDSAGIVFLSDSGNASIRRIDTAGMITTIAGGPNRDGADLGDGGPAAAARISPSGLAIDRTTGDLYAADLGSHRVRKIDAETAVITTVAGSDLNYYEGDFAGDNGPATAAKLHFDFGDLSGFVITPRGDVIFSDSANNRVRTVFACVQATAPALVSPADGATASAPELTWSTAGRADRYDVYLDTVSPPVRLVASDVSGPSFATSNLQPSTKYYWRIVNRGDPFCPEGSASSPVASFTSTGTCTAGAFTAIAPGDNAAVNAPVSLSWIASAGAASYDVYLGTTSPPPLFAEGVTATSLAPSLPNGRYFWFVVAHAACDATRTTATTIRAFDLSGGSSCSPGQISVSLTAPANGSADSGASVELAWSSTGAATSFDVYFGSTPDPPLLNANVTAQRQEVSALSPATRYYWRVVARGPCDTNGVSSAVSSFTTRSCSVPGAVTIGFAPASVSTGTTYAIVWSAASGLDAGGGYLVERSSNPSFAGGVSSQIVSTTAASFDAESVGTFYHRVRAVPACDPSRAGPYSPVRNVAITAARPNVVFTVQPAAEIIPLGDRLSDRRGRFALENIGPSPVQVILGRQEINGSAPFFTIVDPEGGDGAFVTLQPRVPRIFNVHYSGPSNSTDGSYQGVIFAASTGEGLPVTPYAFLNLKVGGAATQAPEILVNGVHAEYAAFPPLAGDDTNRAPLQITVRNNGSSPMDLAAEIGPEVWLVPEAGWNASPLAPGASRTVNLLTRRGRAPNGSALPRYTYLTLRTRDGASTRILVQDNDDVSVSAGRTIRLDAGERSIIVPDAVSRIDTGNVIASTIRLSNIGSERVQADLLFTPSGTDGFDSAVRRAVILIPANDVVTITDPVAQLFHLARPMSGQIEVRIPEGRQGTINVTATTGTPGRATSYDVPVISRGGGARAGADHILLGVRRDSSVATSLVLAETTGTDPTAVRITLRNAEGAVAGSMSVELPRYGHRRFDDIGASLGVTSVDGGRIEISVERGGGAVAGVAFTGGSAVVSVPRDPGSAVASLALRMKGASTSGNVTTVVPLLASANAARPTRTTVGLAAPGGITTVFAASLRNAAGSVVASRQIPVNANATLIIRNVFELFGVSTASSGTMVVEAPSTSKVYAVIESGAGQTTTSQIPLPTNLSESLTSAGVFGQRPLYLDGLEQSTDGSRGSRWMLLLNEVGGAAGSIAVRLYEAGNRSRPIAERDFSVAAYQQLSLDTIFAELGLDSDSRRKDRTNVLLTVTARSGNARIAASAVSTDNVSGDVKVFALQPATGSGSPNISLVSPVQTPPAPRRRAVGR
jgi:sugar lactone lactonase YvrE